MNVNYWNNASQLVKCEYVDVNLIELRFSRDAYNNWFMETIDSSLS
jgi:hypothetical protein